MPEGEVVFWNDTGGYGFIETPATDDDVFVHADDAGIDLAEGDRVAFDVVESPKGPRAESVRRPGGTGRVEGTVDFWNDTGGYGFIETPATDEDVFVHGDDVSLDLAEGDRLSFEVVRAEKGPRAEAVRPADGDDGGLLSGLLGGGSGADDDAGTTAPDDTDVYEGGGSDTEVYEGGSDTEVYDGSAPDASVDGTGGTEGGPAYCFACGADLDPYPDPGFCPDCGTDLDP
jgi:CspA family cold shock protein